MRWLESFDPVFSAVHLGISSRDWNGLEGVGKSQDVEGPRDNDVCLPVQPPLLLPSLSTPPPASHSIPSPCPYPPTRLTPFFPLLSTDISPKPAYLCKMSFLLFWLDCPSPSHPHFFSSGIRACSCMSNSLRLHGLYLLGKNTRVAYHFHLQGILPTQGLSCVSCLLHWQADSFWSQLLFSDLCFLPNLLDIMSVSSSTVLIIAPIKKMLYLSVFRPFSSSEYVTSLRMQQFQKSFLNLLSFSIVLHIWYLVTIFYICYQCNMWNLKNDTSKLMYKTDSQT